jgi:hypothetical protein
MIPAPAKNITAIAINKITNKVNNILLPP